MPTTNRPALDPPAQWARAAMPCATSDEAHALEAAGARAAVELTRAVSRIEARCATAASIGTGR
jgi:hypothetical protein